MAEQRTGEETYAVCGRSTTGGLVCVAAAGHLGPCVASLVTYDDGTDPINFEEIAVDLLRCAIAWDPNVRVLGNVRAVDVARLCAHHINTCPKCGATAWVNIDCDLCGVCHSILREGVQSDDR